MIAVEISFPVGRYHATPWDRHVNEGIAAWPPEPLRILRALIACWHAKADHSKYREDALAQLIDALAEELPVYHLPRANLSHTRHYMPAREGKDERNTLIFDSFVAVNTGECLVIEWPVNLSTEGRDLLEYLVGHLSYLGRSESWIDARVVERPVRMPEITVGPQDERHSGMPGETIDLLAPMTPAAYSAWRADFLNRRINSMEVKRGSKTARALEATLPARLVDLLRVDTSEWQEVGWSHWPGTRVMPYRRPAMWNEIRRPRRRTVEHQFDLARFTLSGRPLPRMEDCVKVGEALRAALMSKSVDDVPLVLSGRTGSEPSVNHTHAFFLPEDANGDGWIDHLLVFAVAGLGSAEAALRRLDKLWFGKRSDRDEMAGRKSGEWYVTLEALVRHRSGGGGVLQSPLLARSRRWVSASPYLHPWFARRNFGPADQLEKEISLREPALPALIAHPERLDSIRVRGTKRLPIHFHRFRSKRGLVQPDRQGSFWRLEFTEAVVGPLAFGFGCHFGLGLFRAEQD